MVMDFKKGLALLLVIVALAFLALRDRPMELGPGVYAVESPWQRNLETPTSFEHEGYTVTRLAEFQIRGKVLSRKRYRWDKGAEVSPIDLALGWGRMSDESVLKDIIFRQSGRWYYWRADQYPIPRREIETHSANMHMVPADKTIRSILKGVREGEIIEIEGYLIRMESSDGFRWKSSMTREDVGDGSCELIFVESIVSSNP